MEVGDFMTTRLDARHSFAVRHADRICEIVADEFGLSKITVYKLALAVWICSSSYPHALTDRIRYSRANMNRAAKRIEELIALEI